MKVGLNSPYTPGETPSIPNIEMPTLSLKLYENQARALNYEMQEPKKKKKDTYSITFNNSASQGKKTLSQAKRYMTSWEKVLAIQSL